MNKIIDNYDYIIVGAGSAGCVVAARLSNAGYKTLLIEAGGNDSSPYIHIPMGYGKLFTNKKINWCYFGEPEPYLNNRKSYQPRGKVLGGTGSINGMIYIRGQKEDFDGWKSLGCTGWSFEDVLPYFKKSENQQRGESHYHGVGGPLHVSDLPSRDELADAFNQTSLNLGAPKNDDFNGITQEGNGYVQVTSKKNRRWSTAAGYIRGLKNTNLHVKLNTFVTKINIKDNKVLGVNYNDKNGNHTVNVNKEVILSGGTFNSPHLLLLSGIGNANELRQLDIPVKLDLPNVGKNLQDHFGIGLEFKCTKPITVNDLYHSYYQRIIAGFQYFIFGNGPMASNGNLANTFIKTGNHIKTPDMMVTFMAWCTGEDLGEPYPFSGFTILAEHIQPKSRGCVNLRSADPFDHPKMQFNFFKAEEDQRAAIAGLKYARKISQTEPMKYYVKEEINPGPQCQSDKDFIEHCKKSGGSLLHPVGTCSMGVNEDAVVDPELKVHGIENLRVVDASIMPKIVSGNTNAATIMIGEKGSDLILKDK
tara:strand:- start:1238 stop:2836 length:1599 start_codon:yes stop_codon:yes gene_type:complete